MAFVYHPANGGYDRRKEYIDAKWFHDPFSDVQMGEHFGYLSCPNFTIGFFRVFLTYVWNLSIKRKEQSFLF